MHKRWLLALVCLTATLAVTAACGGDDDKTKVSLALDWYPNSNHVGLFIAQEKGYFEEEGLEVNMYTPVDPSTVLQTVGAGSDDFGISYQPDVLLARGQGVPVVSVIAIVQHPLNSVMTLTESGISTPRDLVGKKIGYPGIPTNEPLLDTMLKADGARGLEDVELVNVGFDLVPALIGKRVDAIVGAYWTHESILAENQGYPVEVMRMEEWGVPDYYELVVVTSEKILKDDPDVVERFVRALRRGYLDAAADTQKAVDTLLAGTREEVDEAIERPGVDLVAPMWSAGTAAFGWQDQQRWMVFTQWMQDNGLLAQSVDHADAFTNSFVEKVAR